MFATKGAGSNDEQRILRLVSGFPVCRFEFDRNSKTAAFRRLVGLIRRERPPLVVMEGTGGAGGLACLVGRLLFGVPYVVSSGDAVGPFIGSHYPLLGPAARLYERALCRLCAGFIGWTPYLVGRALTLGAPRGMTAAGWALGGGTGDGRTRARDRAAIRRRLGIPGDALVFGIAGSLQWNAAKGYCYGLELVRAVRRVSRADVRVLIVGDGSGRPHLEREAGDDLGRRVLLTGDVPLARVMPHLHAMDVAVLPQTLDGVGNFRYTTKVSEYRAAGLPAAVSQVPMVYDLDDSAAWRLPGRTPWGEPFVAALAQLMRTQTHESVGHKAAALAASPADVTFEESRQRARMTAFVSDLLLDGSDAPPADFPPAFAH